MPYTAAAGTVAPCPTSCTAANSTFQHYNVKAGTVNELQGVVAIQQEILANGPVETAFSVFYDFMNYESGVYQHTQGPFVGGHAVKIIGWGTQNSTDYWLVANSWDTTWGALGGYFLIRRGVDECYIESNAIAGLPV